MKIIISNDLRKTSWKLSFSVIKNFNVVKYSFEGGIVKLVYSYIAMAALIYFIDTFDNYFYALIKVLGINPKNGHWKKEMFRVKCF